MITLHRFNTQSLTENINRRQIVELISRGRTLSVFDFDDTLVRTGSRVRVVSDNRPPLTLSSGEFATYILRADEKYDFSEFARIKNQRIIKQIVKIMTAAYHADNNVVILTARGRRELAPVYKFLVDAKLPDIRVIGLSSTDPMAKANWIARRIEHGDIARVEFFDDSFKNISEVDKLSERYPDVEIVTRLTKTAHPRQPVRQNQRQ